MNSSESSGYIPKTDVEAQELKSEQKFDSKFLQIMERSLSPENIDTYAEDALKDLISLVNQCTEEYASAEQTDLTRRELEDLAIAHFGLPGVPQTLDHISQRAEEIRHLDEVIGDALKLDSVIIPPKDQETQIITGEGTFREKLTIARTKTILFILANDFDIEVGDPEQLKLTKGILNNNMMRKLSYTMIEIPKLERLVLCCDEEGNVTYVFDEVELGKKGIANKDLRDLTKEDIDGLIKGSPTLGSRVVYSDRFIYNMIQQIKSIQPTENNNQEEVGKYLYSDPPSGAIKVDELADKLGVNGTTIRSIAKKSGITLEKFRAARKQPTLFVTINQQSQIIQDLYEQGTISKDAPEGTLRIPEFADKLGLPRVTVSASGERMGLDFEKYMFPHPHGARKGITPNQQADITQDLHERDLLVDNAPDGTQTINEFADKLGVDDTVIRRSIERQGIHLLKYRFEESKPPAIGIIPQLQKQILEELERRGALAGEAPSGAIKIEDFASKLGVTYTTIRDSADRLKLDLKKFKFSKDIKSAITATTEQQKLITQELHERGALAENAPIGTLRVEDFAIDLGLGKFGNSAIRRAADRLNIKFDKYRFTDITRPAQGVTVDQQKTLSEYFLQLGE